MRPQDICWITVDTQLPSIQSLIQHIIADGLEAIPAAIQQEAGYTIERL